MPQRWIADPSKLGLTYLKWALSNGRVLSREVDRRVKLEDGTIDAFVPEEQQLANFRWGGGSPVKEALAAIATIFQEFLSTEGRVVVFEHHLIAVTDDFAWLKSPVRLAQDGVFQFAASGAPRVELDRLIANWSYLPIYNAFLSEIGDVEVRRLSSSPEKSQLDVGLIVGGLRKIVCGAYDEEGAVVWSASAPSMS